MTDAELDEALLKAHEKNDTQKLITLYRQAGLSRLQVNDVDAGCFYLTHAYIFALEAGAPDAKELHQILITHGREE